MYTKQPKKLLIMNILDILRRYSDENHRLSQKDILEILEKDYNMTADRKAVKRNLMNLIDFGYNLEYTEAVRIGKDGEEEIICTDWYLQREFSDAELRLLIDSLLFSKHIPTSQCHDLIKKIEGLSNKYFQSRVRHVCSLPTDQPQNAELFYTIEILDEAIERQRQVVFHYGDFDTDKKLQLRKNRRGEARSYQVSPYQMAATNGRYYLIANMNKHEGVAHYRLDHIRDIEITDEPAIPLARVKGMENGLDLPKHMAEHVYMYAGKSERIVMRTTPNMAGELIDWFGGGVTFSDVAEDSVVATVWCSLMAARFWALQYAAHVTVLEPKELVDQVKMELEKALGRYGDE